MTLEKRVQQIQREREAEDKYTLAVEGIRKDFARRIITQAEAAKRLTEASKILHPDN